MHAETRKKIDKKKQIKAKRYVMKMMKKVSKLSIAKRVRGCGRPNPSTGGVGDPKFFLNWLTSASKPYDSDHISCFSSTSRYTPLDSSWPSLLLPLTSIIEKIFTRNRKQKSYNKIKK